MTRPYRPRRASATWLEGAPEYILDVFDNKGRTADRYTVLFGGSLLDDILLKHRKVHGLAMSYCPTHPQGVSLWIESPTTWRPSHQRIKWSDLPDHIQRHIIARATS